VDNLEFSRIDYELSALPRRLGLLTIPIGFALAAASVLGDPTSLEDFVPRTALPYLAAITLAGFVTTTFFCLLLRSARQLQMVSRLHARATNISLLKLHPTQALSALTAQTAIAVILFLVIGYLLDPSSFGTAWDIASYFAVVLLAIAIFALPLMGMRNHLEVEKLRMLDHISDLLKIASDRLHSNVTSEHYADMKETEAAINALLSERDLISKISTFPWHPTAVRGLASAIVLPLFLWLVTRLLENVI
jgi:hypothetical protein